MGDPLLEVLFGGEGWSGGSRHGGGQGDGASMNLQRGARHNGFGKGDGDGYGKGDGGDSFGQGFGQANGHGSSYRTPTAGDDPHRGWDWAVAFALELDLSQIPASLWATRSTPEGRAVLIDFVRQHQLRTLAAIWDRPT